MPHQKILLFDIDGTLLATRGAGRLALFSALMAEFDVEGPEDLEFSGRTDRELLTSLVKWCGHGEDEEKISRLRNAYVSRLGSYLCQTQGAILPGVIPLLEGLYQVADFRLGVLTGNLPETGELKLRHFGLWDFFDLHFYGDQFSLRTDLMVHAKTQLAALYTSLADDQVCVIGDTPLDIAGAPAIGARCLATATGIYPASELSRWNPSRVVEDLTDTEDVINWLGKP
jgi:phosphoglycolate phosphatase